MKSLAVTFLAVTAFTVGCKPSEKSSATQTGDIPTEQFDQIKQETQKAAQAIQEYAYTQKTEFVATMQDQLDVINRDLDQLAAKVEKSSDAVKAESKPKIQALRDQTAKLIQQLEMAQDATESTWGDVKAGFATGYDELKDGFKQARQWVSDKIEP